MEGEEDVVVDEWPVVGLGVKGSDYAVNGSACAVNSSLLDVIGPEYAATGPVYDVSVSASAVKGSGSANAVNGSDHGYAVSGPANTVNWSACTVNGRYSRSATRKGVFKNCDETFDQTGDGHKNVPRTEKTGGKSGDNQHLFSEVVKVSSVSEQIRSVGEQVRSVGEQMVLLTKLTSTDEHHRLQVDTLFQFIVSVMGPVFPGCGVHFFGSTINGLGGNNSDVDIHLDLENQLNADRSVINKKRKFLMIEEVLMANTECRNVTPVPNARVPVIKFLHVPTGLSCDLSFKNMMGVFNSQFIQACRSFDKRFLPLFMTIKALGKQHGLLGGGGGERFTSYSLTLLLVFFLQQLENPILPPVAELLDFKDKNPTKNINGWIYTFNFNKINNINKENSMDLDQLLTGFFEFYSTFYYEFIICPYFATEITRESFKAKSLVGLDLWLEFTYPKPAKHFMWCFDDTTVYKRGLQINSPLCVQDPFELNHNVTKNVDMLTLRKFRQFCSQAVHVFSMINPRVSLPNRSNDHCSVDLTNRPADTKRGSGDKIFLYDNEEHLAISPTKDSDLEDHLVTSKQRLEGCLVTSKQRLEDCLVTSKHDLRSCSRMPDNSSVKSDDSLESTVSVRSGPSKTRSLSQLFDLRLSAVSFDEYSDRQLIPANTSPLKTSALKNTTSPTKKNSSHTKKTTCSKEKTISHSSSEKLTTSPSKEIDYFSTEIATSPFPFSTTPLAPISPLTLDHSTNSLLKSGYRLTTPSNQLLCYICGLHSTPYDSFIQLRAHLLLKHKSVTRKYLFRPVQVFETVLSGRKHKYSLGLLQNICCMPEHIEECQEELRFEFYTKNKVSAEKKEHSPEKK